LAPCWTIWLYVAPPCSEKAKAQLNIKLRLIYLAPLLICRNKQHLNLQIIYSSAGGRFFIIPQHAYFSLLYLNDSARCEINLLILRFKNDANLLICCVLIGVVIPITLLHSRLDRLLL
jgi:hypothetical protein